MNNDDKPSVIASLDRAALMTRIPPQGGSSTAPPKHTCQSSATHAGVVQAQHTHLADEIARLTQRVSELDARLRDLLAMNH